MKTFFKKPVSYILVLCLLLCTALPALGVSAAIVEKGQITIGTVSGNVGDTVIVPVTIAENPGIAAVTVSITYDSSALEFIEDLRGDVLYEYMTKAHPTRNIIRLVTCEQGNKHNNGTLVNLKFKIADKAAPGLYKMDMIYRAGDFCNWKLDKIMPSVTPGGVNVNLTVDNCPHASYGEWTLAAIATCTEPGAEKRICNFCGHVELRDTAPLGHEYSDKFTIDKPATEKETGLMSRHCIRCSSFIDQISYTLEQSDEGDFDNTIYEEVAPNDTINDIYKEQYPDPPDEISSENDSQSTPSKPAESAIDETSSSDAPESTDGIPDAVAPKPNDYIPDELIRMTVKGKIAQIIPEIDSIIKYIKIALLPLFAFNLF